MSLRIVFISVTAGMVLMLKSFMFMNQIAMIRIVDPAYQVSLCVKSKYWKSVSNSDAKIVILRMFRIRNVNNRKARLLILVSSFIGVVRFRAVRRKYAAPAMHAEISSM